MPLMFQFHAARLTAAAVLTTFLSACGGGGDGDGANPQASNPVGNQYADVVPPRPDQPTNFLAKPVLSFSDTGLSVNDGVTSIGKWDVRTPGGWEYSFNMGTTWIRGQGDFFDVKGDGAKTIWVRARDDLGNTSDIVVVSCVLDTMPPPPVQTAVLSQDVTRLVRIAAVEDRGRWEYSVDNQRTWLPGTGDRLAIMGNALPTLWLRQVDLAGNLSPVEQVNIQEPNSTTWHEASGNALQPSLLSLQQARTVLLHGSVVRGDADYIRWDIPVGMKLQAMRLINYVSDDQIAFFAVQRAPTFDAGTDVTRMVTYGHMGPQDLKRNVLQDIAPGQLTAGPMTLWFQQTGVQATEYAIELVFQPLE